MRAKFCIFFLFSVTVLKLKRLVTTQFNDQNVLAFMAKCFCFMTEGKKNCFGVMTFNFLFQNGPHVIYKQRLLFICQTHQEKLSAFSLSPLRFRYIFAPRVVRYPGDKVKVQFKFAGAIFLVQKICLFIVVSQETGAHGILKDPWRERIYFKETVTTSIDVLLSFLNQF